MLWYGKNQITNFKNIYKHHSYRYNIFTKTLAFNLVKRNSLSYTSVFLYIPHGWNLILLQPKNIYFRTKLLYLFSQIYFFKISVLSPNLQWFYDIQTSTLLLTNRYTPNFYKLYFKQILNIFYSFSKLFFLKLKFKGKGYYIYKNTRNTITPQFGHSHRIYIYAYFLSVKFLTKTTVFLFGSSKNDILTVSHAIKNAKFINIFTGRGVRFARQIIYKKTGKVSSYR
jgi:ribosomal protein L6P/L9E